MMTSDQIVKAKELARKCVAKNYKDCKYILAANSPSIV
jgi:hypothetical protein